MSVILITFAVLLGAGIGSFLNVVAVRTHEQKTLGGRSVCAACGKVLGVLELVPVFGYAWLRGKCRSCQACIPAFHPAVELVTAILFGLVVWVHTSTMLVMTLPIALAIVRDLAAVSFFILLSLTDILYGELPDQFTWVAIVILGILSWAAGMTPLAVLFGACVGAAFFLVQRIVSRGAWVGDGDVFLGAAIGVLLGPWFGLGAILLGYVFGAVVAVVLLATKKVTRKTQLPFAPYLALGAVTVLLFGSVLWEAYLAFFTSF